MTDQQALAAYARERDPAAFALLVERYQQLVYAACRRQLAREADVQDAVQQTFFRLARHGGMISTSLANWLYTCAMHVAVDMIRADASRRRRELAWAEQVPSAEERQAQEQLLGAVDEAMLELTPADRELIVEHYLNGQTQTALARQADLTPAGVKWRLDRAVERLRTLLRTRGVEVSAIAIATFAAADMSSAAVPATLTTELTKIGIAGVGTQTIGTGLKVGAITMSMKAQIAVAVALGALGLTGGIALVAPKLAGSPPATAPTTAPALSALADEVAKAVVHAVGSATPPGEDGVAQEKINAIGEDMRRFVNAHAILNIDADAQARLIESLSAHLNETITKRDKDQLWLELSDTIQSLRLKLHLALVGMDMSDAQKAAQAEQRQWIRQIVDDLSDKPVPSNLNAMQRAMMAAKGAPSPLSPRQQQSMAFDIATNDPLDPLSWPMSEEQFDRLRAEFEKPNTLGLEVIPKIAWIAGPIIAHNAASAAVGEDFTGVTCQWGSSSSSVGAILDFQFPSNSPRRGAGVRLQTTKDVTWGIQFNPLTGLPEVGEARLERLVVGVTPDVREIEGKNGTRIAHLPVSSWKQADGWSDERLRQLITERGAASVPVPPTNPKPNSIDPPAADKAFYVFQTPAGNMAVLKITRVWRTDQPLIEAVVRSRR
jgi:RNA polymerase sigma-70 factor (ECF subfamily)